MRALTITTSIDVAYRRELLTQHIRDAAGISPDAPLLFTLKRRSVDARQRSLKAELEVELYSDELDQQRSAPPPLTARPLPSDAPRVIIVGAGPAGLFAALRAISLGLRPIVLERGESVRSRRRDLAQLNRRGEVNPDSNYCFGEGGAGTYSDGKLYTRSKKRGAIRAVLQLLVDHGAPEEILFESQPHIGTNRLPQVITAIRETIEGCGGEVRFRARVVDLKVEERAHEKTVRGVLLMSGELLEAEAGVILATGHSARDIFELLDRRGVALEAKPFALGLRVEHPQTLIDRARYRGARPAELGSAAYKLVTQVEGRGVFSFCMCPGGIIAPAATAPGEVVVNGWSPYKRNGNYANSGVVVSVDHSDFAPFARRDADPLAGLRFQAEVERAAFRAGGSRGVTAPAQRLIDFVKGRDSRDLPACSYIPGVQSADLTAVLPSAVATRLQRGMRDFDRKIRGYLHDEAILVGVESRTSSPVRIPRERDTLQHPEHRRLFPCGEGAGYAGGIMSAALDGFRCVEAAAQLHRDAALDGFDTWSESLSRYADRAQRRSL